MPTLSSDWKSALNKLYANFPDLRAEREVLQPAIQVLEYGAGETIFQRGSPLEYLYFLLTGSVEERGLKRMADGARRQRLVRRVEAPRLLGIYDFLYRQPHSTHAVTRELSQILQISVQAFEKLLIARPDLRARLIPQPLIQRLRTIPLLAALDLTELSYLAEATQPREYAAGSTVYQASAGATDEVYLLDEGQVQVVEMSGKTVWLGNGAAFGLPDVDEHARAVTDASIYAIPRPALTALTAVDVLSAGVALRRAVPTALGQLHLFSDSVFQDQLERLAGFVSHYVIPEKYLVLQHSEVSDSVWILMPGSHAWVYAPGATGPGMGPTAPVGPLDFCEGALFAQVIVEATVEAQAGSQWLRLHRLDFQQFVGQHGADLWQKLALRPGLAPATGKAQTPVHYAWLQDGEGVVLLRHRHWFILLAKIWLALALGLAALAGFASAAVLPVVLLWLAPLLLLVGLGALAVLIWQLIDFWNDYIVVTTRRVVRQEKQLLRTVRLQEAGLEQIQQVDVRKSFPGSWLGFGALTIQTAGTRGAIRFDYIPGVEDVKAAINAQKTRRLGYRQAASKLEIQHYLEGNLGITLKLPERVWPEAKRSTFVQRWGEQFQRMIKRPEDQRRPPKQEHMVWRKHWLVLLQRLLLPMTLLALTLALLGVETLFATLWLANLITLPLTLVLMVVMLAALAWIAWRYADWRNDTYEVTLDEVADVEKLPLFFDEKRRTARLLDIDNIRSEVPSMLHYLFNYGNVRLETAAEEGSFTFDSVPNPSGVVTEIRRRIEAARRRQEEERAQQRASELRDWFEVYSRLKG